MKIVAKNLVSVTTILSLSLVSLGAVPAVANATESTQLQSVTKEETVTPKDLPVRSLEDVEAEASSKGYAPAAVQTAVQLQAVINAYHELPENLQGKPTSDPEVRTALEKKLEGQGIPVSPQNAEPTPIRNGVRPVSAAAGFDPISAVDCALAIADAVSIAVPGANAWKWIKAAGGVITVAEAVNEVLQGKAQDSLIKVLGKEAGNQVKKVLGVQGVIDSCKL